LNHYAIQSLDWFKAVKMTRGAADSANYDKIRDLTYFKRYDAPATVVDTELKDMKAGLWGEIAEANCIAEYGKKWHKVKAAQSNTSCLPEANIYYSEHTLAEFREFNCCLNGLSPLGTGHWAPPLGFGFGKPRCMSLGTGTAQVPVSR
jgi:hypothetical protein